VRCAAGWWCSMTCGPCGMFWRDMLYGSGAVCKTSPASFKLKANRPPFPACTGEGS
jgi:hypothetical protein